MSEQLLLHDIARVWVATEVFVGQRGHHSASWSALNKALHDKEWLVNVLYRTRVFADGCGDSGYTYRATAELIYYGKQYLIVDFIQSVRIDVQCTSRQLRDVVGDGAVAFHLCEVANPT